MKHLSLIQDLSKPDKDLVQETIISPSLLT